MRRLIDVFARARAESPIEAGNNESPRLYVALTVRFLFQPPAWSAD